MKNFFSIVMKNWAIRKHKWIDLTAVWNQCHSHLKPYTENILHSYDSTPCPFCKANNTTEVLAHIRYGDNDWHHNCQVTYCGSCEKYSISPDQITTQETNPASKVTAIDARLWSQRPTVLNIEPTTRCNYRCWYCIGRTMHQQDLTLEDFEKAINNFSSLEIVAIVGEGEPILNKQFFSMVKLAKERGLRVVTLSNGSTFSESVIRKICDSKVDYIGISIDSTDPEEFSQSREGGDLHKVWSNIRSLVEYRNNNGYEYPILGLKGTLFSHTEDKLVEIAKEAKRNGIDALESFQPLNPKNNYLAIYPNDKRSWILDYKRIAGKISEQTIQAEEILPNVSEFAIREQMNLRAFGTRNPLRPNCDEAWLYALQSGDVTPCCQIKTPIQQEWNLLNYPVSAILSSHSYEQMRFNLWNGIFPKYCDGCSRTICQ